MSGQLPVTAPSARRADGPSHRRGTAGTWRKALAVAAGALLVSCGSGADSVGRSQARFIRELAAGEPQHLIVYGTSLSRTGAWVPQLKAVLDERFPGLLRLTNAARDGQSSAWGLAEVEDRVIAHRPDVVFIEFAINDSVTRFQLSLAQVRANLEGMLDRIRAALPGCEIILQLMNPVVGKPESDPSHRRDQAAYRDLYRQVARERGLLLIDHSPAWNALLTSVGEEGYKQFVPDGVHPNAEGWRRYVLPTLLRELGLAGPSPARK